MKKIAFSQRLESVEEYFFSKKLRQIQLLNKQGHNIINLGIGSPDLPPHSSVIDVLKADADKPNTHAYQSYVGIPDLRKAIVEWYAKIYMVEGLNYESQIIPLMGSKEGIMHLSMSLLNKDDKVLIPDPGYPNYTSATKLAEGIPVFYSLLEKNHWQINRNEIENHFQTHSPKIIWLNSPHMPTGVEMDDDDLLFILQLAKQYGTMVCHDNPYSMVRNQKPKSIFRFHEAFDVAIELNSFSKSYNMAGWRIGMMIGRADYLKEILKFKTNMDSGMFHPIQVAAIQALALGDEWINELNEEYNERAKLAKEILLYLKCTFDENQKGLFLWALIPENELDAITFTDKLLEKSKVFITPGTIFGDNGSKHIRISLCSNRHLLMESLNRIKNSFS